MVSKDYLVNSQPVRSSDSNLTSEEVCKYLWTVLLAELQANQRDFESFEAYQEAAKKLQELYQQARETNDPNELEAIKRAAEKAVDPHSNNDPTDSGKARKIDENAEKIIEQLDKEIDALEGKIDGAEAIIAELKKKIAEYKKQIEEGSYSDEVKDHLAKAEADLKKAESTIEALKAQKAELEAFHKKIEDLGKQIGDLADGVVDGEQGNAEILEKMNELLKNLEAEREAFEKGLGGNVQKGITDFTNFINDTLKKDIEQLGKDVDSNPDSDLTPSYVCDYIWNILLVELQKNYYEFDSLKDYNAAASKLQDLWLQARDAKNLPEPERSAELERILNEAKDAVHPTPLSPDQKKANEIDSNAQKMIDELQKEIDKLKNRVDGAENVIKSLEEKIAKYKEMIEKGDYSKETLEDLKDAEEKLASAKELLNNLQGQIDSITDTKKKLEELSRKMKDLDGKINPEGDNTEILKQMEELLQQIQAIQQNFNQNVKSDLEAKVQGLQDFVQNQLLPAVNKVREDIDPKPEPGDYKIENGTWYIDWTSFDFPIPEGVDVVNIFVGEIQQNADGTYKIGGFDNMTPEKLREFIQKCHEKGIKVKLSLGGSEAGRYGATWDKVLDGNHDINMDAIKEIAKAMADACGPYDPENNPNGLGADGVDFDFEEWDRPYQENLEKGVGKLIQEFKKLTDHMTDANGNPRHIEATLCSNAGFGTWKDHIENILDPDGTGETVVDRLYLMTYYRSAGEELEDVKRWTKELEEKYNFSHAQIGIGIDTFDGPHQGGYDDYLREMAEFAKENGYSTEFWAFDPGKRDLDGYDNVRDYYANILDRILHPEKYEGKVQQTAEAAVGETDLDDTAFLNAQLILAQGA